MEEIVRYINKKYSFGLDISKVKKINASTNNKVFNLGDFILKISENKYNLKKEFDILNLINGKIASPKPILYDELDNKYFLIIEKIEGETLDYYWNNFESEVKENVLDQIVYNMKILHNIYCDHFVDYFGGEKIEADSYFEIMKIKLDKVKIKSFENKDVSKDTLTRFIEYFEYNKNVFDYATASLVHNDLWYKNIMYDNSGHVYLIDFETSIYAPKQIELFSIYNHLLSAKNYLDKDPQDYKEFEFLNKFISNIKSNYRELTDYNPKQYTLYKILKYFNMLANFEKTWYNFDDIQKFENDIILT